MNLAPVRLLAVFYDPEEGRRVKVGRLARKDREILFEYDPAFLASGLELSPFKLPLRPGVVSGNRGLFDGLPGLFEDSLPDGWGRLLIDRRAAKGGLSPAQLGPLDRLALIGARAMGALVYQPEHGDAPPGVVSLPALAADAAAVLGGAHRENLEQLISLGGSPQGARPKVLLQVADDGSAFYGDRDSRPGCTPYLVKFRAERDDVHAGALEHAYLRMAAAAGIDTPRTLLLGRTRSHPGYFAIERFDRAGKTRVHLHTFSGLVHAPHTYPSTTYQDLLRATRDLTRDESAVAEMFRRACFNVFAHNRDDHTRNFAFLMSERGVWRPSPAYDLTLSEGPGGEHSMLIGTEGANPTATHLLSLAEAVGLKRPRRIVDEVRAAVDSFRRHADEAGLPKRLRERVARRLGVPATSPPSARSRSARSSARTPAGRGPPRSPRPRARPPPRG